MSLGEKIRDRRSMLGITQQELADISEVGLKTISNLEIGKGNPSVSTINKVLSVLGMELDIKIKNSDE